MFPDRKKPRGYGAAGIYQAATTQSDAVLFGAFNMTGTAAFFAVFICLGGGRTAFVRAGLTLLGGRGTAFTRLGFGGGFFVLSGE